MNLESKKIGRHLAMVHKQTSKQAYKQTTD